MKLQEFVTETLREIITGVKEAQQYAGAQGAKINPPSRKLGELKSIRIVDASTGQLLREVEFDVAVTFTEGAGQEGGGGIFVAGLGLGAKAKSETSSSSVSRVRFSVPLSLPVQHETKD